MNKTKTEMEQNPLLKVYLKIIPAVVIAVVVIYFLVKVISGLIAPNQLELQVTYNDFEQGAVMQTAMRAAADENFEEPLTQVVRKKTGFQEIADFFNFGAEETVEAENGTYTFKYEYRDELPAVYVKQPEWWCPIEMEEVRLPLAEGSSGVIPESGETFEIKNVEVIKISTGIFNVNVTLSAGANAAPTNVQLSMGGYVFDEWDETETVSYDPETGFAERTLVYRFNRDARDDLSDLMDDAELAVSEYTAHRQYMDVEISSNVDGLSIHIVE